MGKREEGLVFITITLCMEIKVTRLPGKCQTKVCQYRPALPLCKDENEGQQHILKCRVLLPKFEATNLTTENVTYEDLFYG